jgi:Holliday junction resolvase-like predicted endonuclease
MVCLMPGEDIGESLVGSYFRHIEDCDVVVYNSFFRDRQGEVDVVALKRQPSRTVILCEVTTHIEGMLIVRKGLNQTEHVIRQKLDRLASFAAVTFPDERHRFEWWSPRVSVGRLTDAMQAIEVEQQAQGRDMRFVINQDYTTGFAGWSSTPEGTLLRPANPPTACSRYLVGCAAAIFRSRKFVRAHLRLPHSRRGGCRESE